MATSKKCPQAEAVARLIDGELSPARRNELETHIAECRDCYEILTESTEVWWRLGETTRSDTNGVDHDAEGGDESKRG